MTTQSIKNLCSGFSYCLTILDNIYVWHGRGSVNQERHAARAYAESLSQSENGANIVEYVEGENDDDEMFWMMLGDDDYARADYWRWRRQAMHSVEPRVWRVNAGDVKNLVSRRPFASWLHRSNVLS